MYLLAQKEHHCLSAVINTSHLALLSPIPSPLTHLLVPYLYFSHPFLRPFHRAVTSSLCVRACKLPACLPPRECMYKCLSTWYGIALEVVQSLLGYQRGREIPSIRPSVPLPPVVCLSVLCNFEKSQLFGNQAESSQDSWYSE